MKTPCRILLLAFLPLVLRADPSPDFPRVEDTSHAEADGSRVIELSVEVPAAPAEVWKALTTAEGWKSFAVKFAAVDFRVGGIIETSYDPNARAGDPDNIKNEIVAYIPGRMLAIRCVQAPRKFEHREEFFSTATVMEWSVTPAGTTRVRGTSVGFRPGAGFDALYPKFRWGNAYTLEKLRQRFEPAKPADTPPAAAGIAK